MKDDKDKIIDPNVGVVYDTNEQINLKSVFPDFKFKNVTPTGNEGLYRYIDPDTGKSYILEGYAPYLDEVLISKDNRSTYPLVRIGLLLTLILTGRQMNYLRIFFTTDRSPS